MFTGLVEAIGEVISFTQTDGAPRLTVAAPILAARLATGDSVAVSGVCLTALSIEPAASPPRFSADLAAETLARTTLSRLMPGSLVNLELPTPAGAPLGGHVVQGHVDGVATLLALDAVTPGAPDSDWIMRLQLPLELTRYVVAKGSIAIEGISLTVAAIEDDVVRIAIIPHTYRATSLHALAVGTSLNIEVDILAKYAERQAGSASTHVPTQPSAARLLTAASLIARGY